MNRVLSQGEAEMYYVQKKAKIEAWWEELEDFERAAVYEHCTTLRHKLVCDHKWRPVIKGIADQMAVCNGCGIPNYEPKKGDFDWITCDHDWKKMEGRHIWACYKKDCQCAIPHDPKHGLYHELAW